MSLEMKIRVPLDASARNMMFCPEAESQYEACSLISSALGGENTEEELWARQLWMAFKRFC